MHFTMFAPDILFFSAGNIHHDEVNLKLLSFAPGLDDGLVKHVYVWPAPSVPGPGDSNLLSYVYILASSAAAHPDYITLRLLVMLQHGDCHPSNVSIPLQISSFMYEDDYSLLIGFTLAKRTKKRIRNNCICSWKLKTFLL